jgi:hypothetical protein
MVGSTRETSFTPECVMATARDLRSIALSLDGTIEAPHFDRTAFKVRTIYATLAADGRTANLMFTPDEQALKCAVAPEAFSPIPNESGDADQARR